MMKILVAIETDDKKIHADILNLGNNSGEKELGMTFRFLSRNLFFVHSKIAERELKKRRCPHDS